MPWFLTNLESYYAKEMEAWQLARLNKNDSADSAENGADMPIEIRHLEDSEDMMFIPPLFSSLIGETNLTSGCEEQLNKSKSLNDITGLSLPSGPLRLKDAGRSNTCDDPTVPDRGQTRARLLGLKSTKLREENSRHQSVENTECISGSGWLNGNLLHRQHPGSLSSLSSARSSVSAMSIKSDSGVGCAARQVCSVVRCELVSQRTVRSNNRNWCSESQLEQREGTGLTGRLQGGSHNKPFKALSLNTLMKPVLGLAGPGMTEKEKTKAAEVNTMGSIKEVNESDISEANSPNPTPRLKDQRKIHHFSLKAFNFPDEAAMAEHHFKELGRELNIQEENRSSPARSEPNKPTQIEIEVTEITMLKNDEKAGKSLKKQVSLNDELFFLQRREERENIKEQIKRQQSLPESHILSEEKPKTFRDSILAVTQTKKFDIFLEGITKLRKSTVARTDERCSPPPPPEGPGEQKTSLKVGIAKMLNKWKSESDDKTGLKSFTQKRGVNIDPINVFSLRRDQSLDSAATRRGLFHRKGAWSGSPNLLEGGPAGENQSPALLSPTMRRCCLDCPDDSGQSQERRLSQGGSDSSKDSSIQSDTSLDSEDSCISVIYIAKPGITGPGSSQSQRSTSNSSGSSESPPGRGSPGSPHTSALVQTEPEPGREGEEAEEENCPPASHRRLSTPSSPKLPEHKSFEMEDLPDENPINCHPRAYATRVEIDSNPPLSPVPRSDYPIVRHHPLFAKTQRPRSGISSLLVGENVEYMRKPGVSLSKSVQTVRKSSPKLLTFEIFNPETDDLDSDNNESSLSSSPDSEESVISVISDVRNTEQSAKEVLESEAGQEAKKISNEDNFIFKFDIEHVEHRTKVDTFPPTDLCFETESSADSHSQDKTLSDLKSLLEIDEIEKEIERKAEERKKILMSLLDENKSVLQNMKAKGSLTKCDTIEEVKLKTTSQLQSMEELRLPLVSRSQSSSPERQERQDCCKSEPILGPLGPLGPGSSQESLKDVEDIDWASKTKKEDKKSKVSSIQKLKQISGKLQTDTEETLNLFVRDGKSSKVPIEICVTEHSNESVEETEQQSTELTTRVDLPSTYVKDEGQQTRNEESLPTKQKDLNKITKFSEDRKEDKTTEPVSRPSEITEVAASIPFRKLEKKKRDDSLESTASIKSSIQLSESGSVLSHRFSTISISSNVSSEVSLGNTSGVSGSSCYLASMSSADFDDRPALASSFSLSEAEEAEIVPGPACPTPEQSSLSSLKSSGSVKKKAQLSPPRPGDRPKLKSLFKRSSNGNKSGGSGENRSHDGCKEENRSRIGTCSSLSPETSMEQATCVERSSTSVEEELFRNTAATMEDPFSASDSEDSAETGGSLTHHRYYHVFREGEIDHIIEKYVENLHIISSYYDHANWCIIAEKVNVWTL